ncbi:hypothetical protein D3C85_1870620 [compost metagenome]
MTGIACTSLNTEIGATTQLTPVTVVQNTAATLVWTNDQCTVSAAVTADGAVTYTAAPVAGAGATQAQCDEGAGL